MAKNIVHVYGVDYELPVREVHISSLPNAIYPKKEQYFRHMELPYFMEDIEFDQEGNALWTEEQFNFIESEIYRIRKGYWFLNNGEPTYVTGKHYYFLNYFTLEDGNRPSYRDCDRRYYYFLDYCETSPFILGILRVKSRREGATSQASSNMLYTATTTEQAKCGIVSKTGDDAKDVFKEMIVYSFRNLPLYMKPTQASGEDPEKILKFLEQASRTKVKRQANVKEKPRGLNSYINWKNTKLNSYDSKRNTRLLVDEGAKFPKEVPIQRYWSIVKKTLEKGAKKVGFCEMPSTVNKLRDGGEGYKVLFKESDQFKNVKTPSGMYRYFKPAFDGYEGFIDKYGMSVVEKPTAEQEKYLLENSSLTIEEVRLGAKEYLRRKIESIEDDDMRLEEKRMMPFSEEDAFATDDSESFFDMEMIRGTLRELEENKPPLKRVTFGWHNKNNADYRNDGKGNWLILKQPKTPNAYITGADGNKYPSNTHRYKIGVDPFASTIVLGKGSRGVIVVYEQLDEQDPENTGMPVALYIGRPKTKALFHTEVAMAAHYYGCKATYENANDDYFEWFIDNGIKNYIQKTPKSVLDPNKKRRNRNAPKTWGVSPKDPFSLNKQLELAQFWVTHYSHKMYFPDIYNDMTTYDHFDREKSDITVAFMIALVAAAGDVSNVLKKTAEPERFIQTYDVSKVT